MLYDNTYKYLLHEEYMEGLLMTEEKLGISFNKIELELLRMLADNLCQVVDLEPEESEIINKFYKWIDEQQTKLKGGRTS